MRYLLGNIKLTLAALTIALIGLLIYYLSYDDGVYYVYKDSQFPFKTYPDNVAMFDNDDLNVHTKIVYPNNDINADHEIVDQSYLDGSELDRAEQSLSFEYNENIIEYNSDDDFIMEALELLDPQSPTSQTYGIYEKQPTLKEYVLLDDNFIIIDEDLKQNFYVESADSQLTSVSAIDGKPNKTLITDVYNSDPTYLDPIDMESLLRNSEIFTNNVVDNEVLVAMIDDNELPEDKELQTLEIVGSIYPIEKPEDLIVPDIQSIIMDDFDTSAISESVEFKKIYYGVQVSSVSSRLDANKFYESLLVNYNTLLNRNNNSHKNLIKQENLGSLGTWYKLRIGPFDDRSEAKRLCSSMRDEGLEGCIVVELE
jgi:hypothetical protein